MESEERRLVERAVTGDPVAVEALWAHHRRWVATVLLAHMPASASLDDLLQDVAVIVVERVGGLRDPGALRPWLRSVAVNVARGSARRRATRPDPSHLIDEPAPSPADERRAVDLRDTLDHVLALTRQLPPDLREALLLRGVQGLSQADLAATLGLPETTVETRLARARRLLRERLAESDAHALPGRARAGTSVRPRAADPAAAGPPVAASARASPRDGR